MEGVRVQVGGRASGFALDLIWKEGEGMVGIFPFSLTLHQEPRTSYNSLLEPIENGNA